MATNALIGKLDLSDDGVTRITYISVHYDGYPSRCLPILMGHYNTPAKVDELLALGNLSVLDINIGIKIEFNAYDRRETGRQCLAYHRDRGERHRVEVLNHLNARTAFKRRCNEIGYGYLFDTETNEWSVYEH